MADYEHDIFISYRRMDKDWIHWTQDNFLRPLRSLLRPALGNPRAFVDDQIETGASWPAYLAPSWNQTVEWLKEMETVRTIAT